MKEQWTPTIGDEVIHPVTLQKAKITAFGKYERSAVLYGCNSTGCFHFETTNIFEWELDNSGCTHPFDNTKQEYNHHIKELSQFFEKETAAKPSRYSQGSLEVWDAIQQLGADFRQGSIIKYIMRYKHKNKAEDLKKAMNYIAKMLAEETGEDYYKLRKKSLDEL